MPELPAEELIPALADARLRIARLEAELAELQVGAPALPLVLFIDGKRRKPFAQATGIYVRAKDGEAWINADIAQLSTESLRAFLRSRGGRNPWAESLCLMLLGHEGEPKP